MNTKKRIFISSVQKELELERAAVAGLISTDPFLLQHCTPVLFEKEPPPPHPASRPYLATLRSCAVYVLLIANEYGHPDEGISAMHHEYRLALELQLPTIVFLKGATDTGRSEDTNELIKEIKQAGHSYKRFHDREDLKPEMLRALLRTLTEEFGVEATGAEVDEGEHQIESASAFETAVLSDVTAASLDQDLLAAFNQRINAGDTDHAGLSAAEALHARGLAIRGDTPDMYLATAGAFVKRNEGSHLQNSKMLATTNMATLQISTNTPSPPIPEPLNHDDLQTVGRKTRNNPCQDFLVSGRSVRMTSG